MRMKMIAAMASAALLLTGNVAAAQAGSAKALSVTSSAKSLSLAGAAGARTGSAKGKSNKQFGELSPLYILGAVVVVIGILEATEVISIFGDDEPTSP